MDCLDFHCHWFLLCCSYWLVFEIFFSHASGGLGQGVDTTQVWNDFLQDPSQVIIFQFLAVLITMAQFGEEQKLLKK